MLLDIIQSGADESRLKALMSFLFGLFSSHLGLAISGPEGDGKGGAASGTGKKSASEASPGDDPAFDNLRQQFKPELQKLSGRMARAHSLMTSLTKSGLYGMELSSPFGAAVDGQLLLVEDLQKSVKAATVELKVAACDVRCRYSNRRFCRPVFRCRRLMQTFTLAGVAPPCR